MSFSLYPVIAEHLKNNPAAALQLLSGLCILQCTDGLGAQVALLQNPILPAAMLNYTQEEIFRGLPVDKPHTRPFAV